MGCLRGVGGLALALSLSAGCAYQTEAREPAVEDGLPPHAPTFMERGMRISYTADITPDGCTDSYEFESDYLDDDPGNDIELWASSPQGIDRVVFGGVEVSQDSPDPLDRRRWEAARDSFVMGLDVYGWQFSPLVDLCGEGKE